MEQVGFIIIAFFCLFVVACPIITAIISRRRRRRDAVAAAEPRAKNMVRARRKLSTVTACSFSVAPTTGRIQRKSSHDDGEVNDDAGLWLGECPICIGPLVPEPPSRLTHPPLLGDETIAPQDLPSRRQSTNLTPEGRPTATDEISEHNSHSALPFGFHWFPKIRGKGFSGTEEDGEVLTEVDDVLTINSCGHSFHSKCLVSWFLTDRNDCPLCRHLFYTPPSLPSRVFFRVSPTRPAELPSPWV